MEGELLGILTSKKGSVTFYTFGQAICCAVDIDPLVCCYLHFVPTTVSHFMKEDLIRSSSKDRAAGLRKIFLFE